MEKIPSTILLIIILMSHTLVRGQQDALQRYLDGVQYSFTQPDNMRLLGGSFLLSLLALPLDESVKNYAQEKGLMPDELARLGDGFGGRYGHWILLGGQTLDFLLRDRPQKAFREEITYSLAALSFNGIATVIMKEAVGRERPNGRSHRSYPSGHTSHSFTIATICQELYGPRVGLPAYGLAVLVAVSRIHDNKHYLSDVIMGAGLGTAIGRGFAQSYLKKDMTLSVQPLALKITIPL